MTALKGVWGTLLLFLVVMGGIYGGAFTPTEAAGIGAGGAFLIALSRRALTWRIFYEILVDSAQTTAVLFTVLNGALIFPTSSTERDCPTGSCHWSREMTFRRSW